MAEPKFGEAMGKLEKIVADLERGDLTLEESLVKYEEGVKLARLCSNLLEAAQKKVEILMKTEGAKLQKKPFVGLGTGDTIE